MKKLLLALIFCFSLSLSASAQKDYNWLGFGAKAGINTAKLSDLSNIKEAWKAGYNVGIFLELRPFRFFSVTAEALYSKKNFKVTGDLSDLSVNASLGVIDVPILAKFYIFGGLNIYAGVTPSFTVGSKVSLSDQGDTTPLSFKPSTIEIPVGLGYQFGFGLTLDARYNIGATSGILEIPDSMLGNFEQGRVSTFTFLIGWRF